MNSNPRNSQYFAAQGLSSFLAIQATIALLQWGTLTMPPTLPTFCFSIDPFLIISMYA